MTENIRNFSFQILHIQTNKHAHTTSLGYLNGDITLI